MSTLTPDALLAVWEQGRAWRPASRGSDLAIARAIGATQADVAALPLGARNRSLLELRRGLFGRELSGTAACPACHARTEFTLDADVLAADPDAPPEPQIAALDGDEVTFRLPSAADLYEAARREPAEAARAALLSRCILGARRGAAPLPSGSVPEALLDLVIARMEALDPLAETQLRLTCADCGTTWSASLDLAAFFWSELDLLARDLLRDVHRLASAYGWSEAAILAMSPARRQAYVELLG